METQLTDIALFPIPNCVAFPGTLFPLHVFEPRYRHMVEHCIEHNLPMGISHTQKVLSPAKSGQTLEQALNSNQATYKPCEVFSAGLCELVTRFDDGRMRVNVHVDARYQAVDEIQTIPFSIFRCAPYTDNGPLSSDKSRQTQEKILKRLAALTSEVPALQTLLNSEKWIDKDPHDFSFEVFGIVKLNTDMQQAILEATSTDERLDQLLSVLNGDV